MVTRQPHRTGTVQAWWAHTGSTNRGFVTLDPERQREVDTGPVRPAPKKAVGIPFAFDVCRPGARGRPPSGGKSAPKAPTPAAGGGPPQERAKRR